jgi:hypothetical protein
MRVLAVSEATLAAVEQAVLEIEVRFHGARRGYRRERRLQRLVLNAAGTQTRELRGWHDSRNIAAGETIVQRLPNQRAAAYTAERLVPSRVRARPDADGPGRHHGRTLSVRLP